MRIFYASDVHGSDRCFRKFLGARKFYGADALVLGGDITGKAIVPLVEAGGEVRATFLGSEHVLTNAAVVIGLAVAGPARWSLDNAIGWDVHGLGWGIGAAVVALIGGGSVLALFRRSDAAITPNPAAIEA